MTANSVVSQARTIFNSGVSRALPWRLEKLEAMRKMLVEHSDDFATALHEDLHKEATEAWLTETGFVTSEITHLADHLEDWLKPEKVSVPLALQPATARIEREPLGVVLVISPWNYPLQLALAPAAGALAAGNTVVIKPSEHAPATAAALSRWVPEYLGDAVQVVEGAVETTTALLKERFDHIFYTGGPAVAKIVMRAAAEHLTPVTLELGGKSPVYVDESADLAIAARRIAWAKYLNAGQTCVAPDYVLGTATVLRRLEPLLVDAIARQLGQDPAAADAYGRIINAQHFERLSALIAGSEVVHGGTKNAQSKYIEPTVVRASGDAEVMQEEIFGPVLPLVEVASEDAAIEFINQREKPLALYVFSGQDSTRKSFTQRTSSGALVFGIPAAHLLVPGLPFGGVGNSGMGGYHGEHSIRTFSHHKSVLDKPLFPDTLELIYPPYNKVRKAAIKAVVAPAGKLFRRRTSV
ncbi:aldehyde dehydrogenase family protein [Pseudarthrobacter sp. J1763]|uniref:aldehyde dehydrogenase family protein n=1 Tax=Pseudarthrobacter sp. J1763 TaxID=3420445 RepID=UPI003D28DD17